MYKQKSLIVDVQIGVKSLTVHIKHVSIGFN